MEIIPYENRHADGLRNLLMPILRDEHGYDVHYEDMPDLQDIAGHYRVGIGECWVTISKDEVVGVMSILDIGDQQAALRKFFVRKDYRGDKKGTAKHMLQHLVSYAKKSDLNTIILGTTPAFVSGHRFYEKSGFLRLEPEQLPVKFPRSQVHSRFYYLPIEKER
ncbi:MAG: GNAT family N-acetyltransferase [Hyphomicrobiales bacterium]|uniref:GNAT family N-acetyltransferase n=1 Tax=Nisaea sp. TaxID=2024842 RepID=UPI003285200D